MSEQPGVASWPGDPFGGQAEDATEGPAVWPFDPFDQHVVLPAPTAPVPLREGPGPRRDGAKADLAFLARGGVLNFGSTIISAILGFALVTIITRGLGVALSGVFFEAIGLFLIISNTAEFGADAGLLRLIPRYRALHRTHDVRTAFHVGVWPALLGGVGLGAAMYAFAPQLASLFFRTNHVADPRAITLIRVLAPFVPISGISTILIAASRGFGAMIPTVSIENIGKPLLRTIAALAVVVLGLHATALGLGWGVPIVLGLIAIVGWNLQFLGRAERRDRYDPHDRRLRRHLAAEFWRFSLPRGLVGTLSTTQLWLDTLLVGGMVGTQAAAVYTASSRYVGVSIFVISAMNIVIAPQISALLSLKESRRAENVYHTATEWIILTSWPPSFMLATFAPLLLSVFGKQYVAGQTVLMILSLGVLFFLSTGPLISVLVMGGKSGWSLFNNIVSLGANIGLNLLLIPRMGINGAALAWALTGVIGQGTALVEVKVFLRLSPYHWLAFLAGGASAVIFGLGGLLFRVVFGPTAVGFLVYIVSASAVYALFLWRFRSAFKLGELAKALRSAGRGERRATLQPD